MPQALIQVHPDRASLCLAAGEYISRTLEEMLQSRAEVTFVLSGGKTPQPLYELLASGHFRDRLEWTRIHFLWSDERCVAPESSQSNFGMAWNVLLGPVGVKPGNVHRIHGEIEDVEQEARRYETEIRAFVPGEPVPVLDLVLLGLGADGHTASLFPETQWDESRLVIANFVPALDAYRISMTPRLLNAARCILFLTAGIEKAEAVAGVLQNLSVKLPANRILPSNGSVTWFLDSAAASRLRRLP